MKATWRWTYGFAIFIAAYFASFAFFPGLYGFIGVNHYGVWFLDFFALLASNDALSRGLDPFEGHALDYFNRPHVYSSWWLHLRDVGLTRADNFTLGFTLIVVFLAIAVVSLRPRTAREFCWFAVVLCSPPIVLAVNRANNDLVVFLVLASVVPCLLATRRAVRLLAVALVALATGLKFYPAFAALVLLAGDDAREVRARLVLAVLALGFVALGVADDYFRVAPQLPNARGLMSFAAAPLFESIGLSAPWARSAGLFLALVTVALFARAKLFDGWRIAPADRSAWISFVLGAVLLTGCFLVGKNFGYRWVFAVWLAPFLWRLPRDTTAPAGVRRLARTAAILLPFALWADPLVSAMLTYNIGRVETATLDEIAASFFALEQPLIWTFFACLLGFLTHFVKSALLVQRSVPTKAAPAVRLATNNEQ